MYKLTAAIAKEKRYEDKVVQPLHDFVLRNSYKLILQDFTQFKCLDTRCTVKKELNRKPCDGSLYIYNTLQP